MTTHASTWWRCLATPFCTKFLRSYLLVTESGYNCFETPHFHTSRYAAHVGDVLPFTSIIDIDPSPGLSAERPIFARYHAACHRDPQTTSFIMRAALVEAWTPLGPDIKASCDAAEYISLAGPGSILMRWCACKQVFCRENKSVEHGTLEAEYRQSQFCPMLPGDSAGTWRLPEVLMAGCIPVFLFPPLHAVPLPYDIAWKDIAIFINITQARDLWYAEERCAVRCPCAHLTVCLLA